MTRSTLRPQAEVDLVERTHYYRDEGGSDLAARFFDTAMTALDTMFRKFISAKTHLMVIERDDKIAGVVTVEDLVEEIIGHELEDESDVEKNGA